MSVQNMCVLPPSPLLPTPIQKPTLHGITADRMKTKLNVKLRKDQQWGFFSCLAVDLAAEKTLFPWKLKCV